jgi:hypothetical protein
MLANSGNFLKLLLIFMTQIYVILTFVYLGLPVFEKIYEADLSLLSGRLDKYGVLNGTETL